MHTDNLLLTLLFNVLFGAAILLVLWPTVAGGRSLLRGWSIDQPTEPQARQARRYLLDRRMLYPVLFLLCSWLAAVTPIKDMGWSSWFIPVLAALLIAEVFAAFRKPAGVRVATLTRRTWRDLVPLWAMTLLIILAVAGASFAAAGAWWSALGGIGLCLVFVLGLVTLAVRRPVIGDLAVDAALRTRSARVAVGIGVAWMTSMLAVGIRHAGFADAPVSDFVLFFVAIGGWIAVANPIRKLPFVRAAG